MFFRIATQNIALLFQVEFDSFIFTLSKRRRFTHQNDFREYRNYLGGLLLLPKRFNASYGALPYKEKIEHYNTQNLLARSLHPLSYEHNSGFTQFIERSGLAFRPHAQFKKDDLDERHDLYRKIAQQIWNPSLLLKEIS